MAHEIYAKEQPVDKLFSNDYVFEIPGYQRPYAWTTDEAGELLDDLLGAVDDGAADLNELSPYFLGSIVLIKGDTAHAQVVDGQQRLTTLAILLSAIRQLVPPEEARDLTKLLYEPADRIRRTPNRFRLSLREKDREFFQEYILAEGGLDKLQRLAEVLKDSKKNVRDNALLFNRRLRGLKQEQRMRLAQFTATRCFMVAVTTPNLEAAYRIFSVLNDRGLDLYHSDILKAEIIEAIARTVPSQEGDYIKKWEDAEEAVGRESFRDLFGHIRMIFRKTKLKGSVLAELREAAKPKERPREFIDETLMPMTRAYRTIVTATYESVARTKEINVMLRWLMQIDNVDWQPPAILFFARHANDPEALWRFVQDLERLAACLMIRRAGINERIERYARLISAIDAAQDLQASDSPLRLSDQERQAILAQLNGNVYEVEKTRRMILLRLDAALSAGGAEYEHRLVTIEHVLPQTPREGSTWLEWWPSGDQRLGMVHRLGNLTLLDGPKNSQASNWDFDRKKKEYFARRGVSPFQLTTQVLSESAWTPEVVERRQTLLLRTLRQVWRLDET